ncbi:hypothetical protein B0A48_04692 [Cryoendolithus antarcticus]|uniref:Uncharacterized protein n=1 Tax=Cryoendolithus antarcticus TaxID=1507870 RepID=A0A1V8TDE3_9PEZI|nr:hypothetical protein B0A48_04692 [Cryoendolithus antarcticus]
MSETETTTAYKRYLDLIRQEKKLHDTKYKAAAVGAAVIQAMQEIGLEDVTLVVAEDR